MQILKIYHVLCLLDRPTYSPSFRIRFNSEPISDLTACIIKLHVKPAFRRLNIHQNMMCSWCGQIYMYVPPFRWIAQIFSMIIRSHVVLEHSFYIQRCTFVHLWWFNQPQAYAESWRLAFGHSDRIGSGNLGGFASCCFRFKDFNWKRLYQ